MLHIAICDDIALHRNHTEALIKEYFDSKNIQVSDANLYMIVSAIYITMLRNSQGHSLRKTDYYQKSEFLSENKCEKS